MSFHSGQSVMDSIRRIVQALRVSSRQAESSLGLSSAQLFVLQKLAAAGRRVSLSELAAMTLTHISSVSVVVTRLVESELLIKSPSPQDGRKMDVQITNKGLAFLESQRPRTAQEELIAAVERMPAWERDLLSKLLEKLIMECGIVTATDVLGAHPQDQNLQLIDLIPKRSLITADPNESCKDLAERMSLEGVGRLLITEAAEPEKLLGIVTRSDPLKARHRHYTEESKRGTLIRRTAR